MHNQEKAPIDTSHWAYLQGVHSGLSGDTTKRGIMSFGLMCAADAETKKNTRLWLAGFDAGLEARNTAAATRPSTSAWVTDDCGMRSCAHDGY